MEKKSAAINGRISPTLRRRLDDIHKKHLTLDSTVLTYLLEAFCDYVDEHGRVEVPIKITPVNSEAPKAMRKAS